MDEWGLIRKKSAFTLIELIIVITILAIVSTLAFLWMQNYIQDAKNTKIVTELQNAQEWFSVYQIQHGNLPLPEDAITISSYGFLLWYQWSLWDMVAKEIKLSSTPTIQWKNTYFVYNTDVQRNFFQIGWFLSNRSNYFSQTHADGEDKSTFYTLWNQLGILFTQTWGSLSPLSHLKSESFTWIDVKIFSWILSDNREVWALKVIFDNNQENDLVGTGNILENLETDYFQEFDILSPVCGEYYSISNIYSIDPWQWSFWFTWGISIGGNVSVCKSDLFGANILHPDIAMSECLNAWEPSSLYTVANGQYKWDCERNWWGEFFVCQVCTPKGTATTFQTWDEVVMPFCPVWWEPSGETWIWQWSIVCASKIWWGKCKVCKKK